MSTTIRPELSKGSVYWIERHRYYELKHFCLQYPTWKNAYLALDSLSKRPDDLAIFPNSGTHGDPTAKCAEAKMVYREHMNLVEQTAIAADPDLSSYILRAVTTGLSYDYLRTKLDIPCCKEVYYESYRRFFWLLSKARN